MEAEGAVVKITTLNENFTLEDFEKLYGETAVILFDLSPAGVLTPQTPQSSSPVDGERIISLVFEKSEEPKTRLNVGTEDDPEVNLP